MFLNQECLALCVHVCVSVCVCVCTRVCVCHSSTFVKTRLLNDEYITMNLCVCVCVGGGGGGDIVFESRIATVPIMQ